MKKVIWFSRHPISFEEREAIKKWVHKKYGNNQDVEVIYMKEEAQKILASASDVAETYKNIVDTAKDNDCVAVFGVFPAPIRELLVYEHLNEYMDELRHADLHIHRWIPALEAWNVSRPPLPEDNMPHSLIANSTPTFKFKQWCYVGKFEI